MMPAPAITFLPLMIISLKQGAYFFRKLLFTYCPIWYECLKAPLTEGSFWSGAPDRSRTCGLQSRSLTLYPAELRAQNNGAGRCGPHATRILAYIFRVLKYFWTGFWYNRVKSKDQVIAPRRGMQYTAVGGRCRGQADRTNRPMVWIPFPAPCPKRPAAAPY